MHIGEGPTRILQFSTIPSEQPYILIGVHRDTLTDIAVLTVLFWILPAILAIGYLIKRALQLLTNTRSRLVTTGTERNSDPGNGSFHGRSIHGRPIHRVFLLWGLEGYPHFVVKVPDDTPATGNYLRILRLPEAAEKYPEQLAYLILRNRARIQGYTDRGHAERFTPTIEWAIDYFHDEPQEDIHQE